MRVIPLASLDERPPAVTDARALQGQASPDGRQPDVSILLDEADWTVRRIALPAGGLIPPCRMQHGVVFTVLEGCVVFTTGESVDERADDERADLPATTEGPPWTVDAGQTAEIVAPGAVFIAGGATTRSMLAVEPSLVLAVLCRGTSSGSGEEEPGATP